MAEPIRPLQAGQLVRSKAGRDRDSYYLVLRVEPKNGWVWLVDGRKRTAANPKRKNLRHLQPTRLWAAELAPRLRAGAKVTPEELRAALNALLKENPDEEALADV